jgi:hypothetical protein
VPAFSNKRRTFEVQVNGQLTANEPPIAITAAIDAAGVIKIMLPRSLFFLLLSQSSADTSSAKGTRGLSPQNQSPPTRGNPEDC